MDIQVGFVAPGLGALLESSLDLEIQPGVCNQPVPESLAENYNTVVLGSSSELDIPFGPGL